MILACQASSLGHTLTWCPSCWECCRPSPIRGDEGSGARPQRRLYRSLDHSNPIKGFDSCALFLHLSCGILICCRWLQGSIRVLPCPRVLAQPRPLGPGPGATTALAGTSKQML